MDLVEEDVQLYVDPRLLGNGGEPAALVQEQFLVPDLDIDRSEAGQVAVEGRGVGVARIGSCEVAVGELLDPLLVEERILAQVRVHRLADDLHVAIEALKAKFRPFAGGLKT